MPQIIRKKTSIIIIDYDNAFKKEISQYTIEEIEFELKEIIRKAINDDSKLNRILIRLYGGWYRNNILTSKASQLQQLIASTSIFPIIKGDSIIHGSIDLATTLFSIPNYTWGHTYKEKNGIPRLRINTELLSETCTANKASCAPYILYNFTAKKDKVCNVNSCSQVHKDLIKGVEQKMVDTIIACDILTFGSNSDVTSMHIYSDDFDHFPSLAMASYSQFKDKKITLNIKNSQSIDLAKTILAPFNINVQPSIL